jgi:HD superfamily phosphodiesterase
MADSHPISFWYEHLLEKAEGDPELVAHPVATAARCAVLATSCQSDEKDIITAELAGLLHDIGKFPSLDSKTVLHHLTGANYLRSLQEERLANLIAYHSGGKYEAQIAKQSLSAFTEEESLVADIIAICDVTTGPYGNLVGFKERYSEIRVRHKCERNQVIALDLFLPDLMPAVGRVIRKLDSYSLRVQLMQLFADL